MTNSYDGTVAAAYSDDGDDEPVATGRRERPRIVRREPGATTVAPMKMTADGAG